MTLHADDLDPATRARLGLGPKRRTATTKREAPNVDDGSRWRCHTCGATFTRWSTAERHARAAGHHRTDLLTP